MSCLKYTTTAELQYIIDNPSDDEHHNEDEKACSIESVICLPSDIAPGDSDIETIDDDEISPNISSDVSPLTEIAVASNESSEEKYHPATDFKPKWSKTQRVAYNIYPIHEKLKTDTQKVMFEAIGEKNPIELFQLFFDDHVIAKLVEETNRYAAQHNIAKICDKYSIQRFMGILLFSGCHNVPETTLISQRCITNVQNVLHLLPGNGTDARRNFP
ncbi:hypothetical protein PV327_007448 [Microctonus hyperodae]|uniref:PiggyBac transposable element-derived protein domain-containing protein n=1 Tax=Microctonus hyperodae TaxID=165561 RepID=A0AA39KYM7_MICHY|nr:hypothetical protein PV327_007448 [Microctonus hyperodae]